jgi:hypothetical protein
LVIDYGGTKRMSMLPVGVVIPTRNSVAYLPHHVAALSEWIDLAAEVVVVDSESTDGTVEYLQTHLKHPNIRFFQRPRGLYQAWNFGISQITSTAVYISTSGDTLSREGLAEMTQLLASRAADVVISPPRFLTPEGESIPGLEWPIHQLVRNLNLKEPRDLSTAETAIIALVSGSNSFLGSSASNLYRTTTLQKRPFPSDFGHIGDMAWGVAHCAELKVTITPGSFSTFLVHPKDFHPDYAEIAVKLKALAERIKPGLFSHPDLKGNPDIPLAWEALCGYTGEILEQQQIGVERRRRPGFWFNFGAFRARMRRNAHRRRVRQAKAAISRQDLL